MSLNIAQFFTVCTKLTFQATKIIKQIKQSGLLGQHPKGITPVTYADLKVQCMIKSALKTIWPTLSIVGQQNELCFQKTHNHFEKILNLPSKNKHKNQYKDVLSSKLTQFYHEKLMERELKIDDCCAWIDPLDATTSYTLGRLDEVSSLVGLSYKKKAKLGILGKPYLSGNNFKPSVIIGDSNHGEVYVIDQNLEIQNVIKKREVPQNYTIASIQNGSDELKSFVSSIGRGTKETSGCGHKIVMMLEGSVDAMVFPGKETSKWDTCASEALIRAVGGRMTDLYGEDIEYCEEKPPYKNSKGLICTLEDWQLEDIMRVTRKFRLD